MTTPIVTMNMTDQQRAIFYAEYGNARRDEVVGVLLALFLGSFGLHHFYLRNNALGILYACFFWTGIPGILGFIECFFMPGRVRRFNEYQAMWIASNILGRPAYPAGYPAGYVPLTYSPAVAAPAPATSAMTPAIACPACGTPTSAASNFCSRCGAAIAH